jgi:hypothetical protein
VRVLAAIGFVVFAYLLLIPASLFASTVDSACAGSGCDVGLAERILLGALYVACAAAVAFAALSFAAYALRPSAASLTAIRRSLAASAAAVGVVAFVLLALAYPIAGLALAATGAVTLIWLRRLRAPAGPDPSGNGRPPRLR